MEARNLLDAAPYDPETLEVLKQAFDEGLGEYRLDNNSRLGREHNAELGPCNCGARLLR
jgi:hypothetical protein